ncbi:pilus assembly protein [Sphingosinicella sp. BN140058]|uniref:pilus assembly protein n=1 Tax=Sphingosinicella sp. BN140058 TaxID=1892855 RepID=UPI0010109501|nr:pilus assembly protein [Sphingosinicella sp. BN140058]QAY78535.1 TadE/TadG family protein [Sphingosinicella sp. BN140058]
MKRMGLNRLLPRLKQDRGNALPIMAAAMLPIIAAIGSGVDTARIYMTKSKLQEAVDSAALAGRRAMTNDDIETAKPAARSYITFNFPAGYNETTPVVTTITKPDVGTVSVKAETTIPATFMRLFGIRSYPITATSEAKQNFDNLDIMLVLDTTGSMAGTRIQGLRSAVLALYDQLAEAQTTLKSQGLRLRYGIVPYSQTVNVGKLLNSNYIQTSQVPYYATVYSQNKVVPVDLPDFVAGTGDFPYTTEKWAGCIEERKTSNGITANDTRDGAPADAYDLDIDMIPSADNQTKWKPYSGFPTRGQSGSTFNVNWQCPTQATLLAELTRSQMNDKVNALNPAGTTYIDIGMIWGTRMISRNGVFGGDNPTVFNRRPVQRFIIFMTDGEMNTPRGEYSAYGYEVKDGRVGGTSDGDNNGRHLKRFSMACNAAKARDVSIWTIQFGTSGDTAALRNCASNPDQFSMATSSDALIRRFVEIGKNIGPLRLSR